MEPQIIAYLNKYISVCSHVNGKGKGQLSLDILVYLKQPWLFFY